MTNSDRTIRFVRASDAYPYWHNYRYSVPGIGMVGPVYKWLCEQLAEHEWIAEENPCMVVAMKTVAVEADTVSFTPSLRRELRESVEDVLRDIVFRDDAEMEYN